MPHSKMKKPIFKQIVTSSSSDDSRQADHSQMTHTVIASSETLKRASTIKDITETIQDGVDQYDFDMSVDAKVQEIQREMLTYGDEQMNANDLRNVEFRIQSERILAVLDRCIDHVNVMFHLPSLLESQKSNHIEALQSMSFADLKVLKDTYDAFHVSSDAMVK